MRRHRRAVQHCRGTHGTAGTKALRVSLGYRSPAAFAATRLLRQLRTDRAPRVAAVHRRHPDQQHRPRRARPPLTPRPSQRPCSTHRARPPRPHPARSTRRPRHTLPQHPAHPQRRNVHAPQRTHPAAGHHAPTARHQPRCVDRTRHPKAPENPATTRDFASHQRKLPSKRTSVAGQSMCRPA